MPGLHVEREDGELRISVVVPMGAGAATVIGKLGAAGAGAVKAVKSTCRPAAAVESLIENKRLGITHTPTFSIVRWDGETFAFTPKQAAIVEALVDAISERGIEYLDERTLLACAESEGGRVYPIFKGHPAWGRWIVSATSLSHRPATYRIAKPF